MDFIESLKEKARLKRKTIVLPEGMDSRTYAAAEQIIKDDFADIIILATDEMVSQYGEGYNIEGVTIINPLTSDKTMEYAEGFFELRKAKGMTREQAKAVVVSDFMYFACMMVKNGDADGVVSGACHSSANTLRPSLQIIKTKQGSKLVSAFFVICVQDKSLGSDGVFVFADCGLNQKPTAAQLADIAGDSAHEEVEKVVEATKIAKATHPDYLIDGELQTDAAVVPEIAEFKAPGSPVAGRANVLVFPDLDTGNIGYKLVQRLGNAEAYGPLCQGIAKPVNDLSRGCSAKDIVGVVAITAVQAQIS